MLKERPHPKPRALAAEHDRRSDGVRPVDAADRFKDNTQKLRRLFQQAHLPCLEVIDPDGEPPGTRPTDAGHSSAASSHQVTLPSGFRVGYQPHRSLSVSTRNRPRPLSASSAGKPPSTTRDTGGRMLLSHTSMRRQSRFAERRTFTGWSLTIARAP